MWKKIIQELHKHSWWYTFAIQEICSNNIEFSCKRISIYQKNLALMETQEHKKERVINHVLILSNMLNKSRHFQNMKQLPPSFQPKQKNI